MLNQVSLYVTRFPIACETGTIFDAIDLALSDDQCQLSDGFWMISEEKTRMAQGTTITRIHTAKYGFLYSLSVPAGVPVGSWITNLNEATRVNNKVNKRFAIRDSAGKKLAFVADDMPIVVRGNGFFGVCTSVNGEHCIGDFFISKGPDKSLQGEVQLDGFEMSGPIYLETF